MTTGAHLWAVAFDDIKRAELVRAEIAKLGETQCLILLDAAVAIRYADGITTLNGEPFISIRCSQVLLSQGQGCPFPHPTEVISGIRLGV
jgi:hypothetical protein